MRQSIRIVACIVLCANTLIALASPGLAQTSVNPLYAPIIDSMEADLLEQTGDLTNYVVDASLSEASTAASATITGTLSVEYINQTGDSLDEIPFRLYANNAEYAEGAITVDDIMVDGEPAISALSLDDTLLSVEIPETVETGGTLEIDLSFVTTLPTDPAQSYGMFKFDTDTNTYSLAHWLPLLAGWDAVMAGIPARSASMETLSTPRRQCLTSRSRILAIWFW